MSGARNVDPCMSLQCGIVSKLDMSCHLLTFHRNYFQFPTNAILIPSI